MKDYVGSECTLDGRPATIMGRQLPFLVVAQIPQGQRCEYSREAVQLVMEERGGAFKS